MKTDNTVVITPMTPTENMCYSRQQKSSFYATITSRSDEVTGNCYIISIMADSNKPYTIMTDCGAFREKEFMYRNTNLNESINISEIDCVIITHPHDDHIGLLSVLVKNGYRGKIYCTKITSQILRPMQEDTLKIQKLNYEKDGIKPQFDNSDIENMIKLIEVVNYNHKINLHKNVSVTFYPNAHIAGSAYIYLEARPNRSKKADDAITILFTGDRKTDNLLFSTPDLPDKVYQNTKVLIQETTNALTSITDVDTNYFEKQVIEHFKSGKKCLFIGGFAQERSQVLGYLIQKLKNEKKIPDIPVFIDGKLMYQINEIYQKNSSFFDKVRNYNFESHTKVYSREEYNQLPKDKQLKCIPRDKLSLLNTRSIIISTAGMFSHGPIVKYLFDNIDNPNATFFIPGYCAKDTISNKLKMAIENNEDFLELSNTTKKIRAKFVFLNQFSGHDRIESSMDFRNKFSNIKLDIVIHGSNDARCRYIDQLLRHESIFTKAIINLNSKNAIRVDKYGLVKVFPV